MKKNNQKVEKIYINMTAEEIDKKARLLEENAINRFPEMQFNNERRWLNVICNTNEKAQFFRKVFREAIQYNYLSMSEVFQYRTVQMEKGRGLNITLEQLKQAYKTDFFQFRDILQEMFLEPFSQRDIGYVIDKIENKGFTLEHIYNFRRIDDGRLMQLFGWGTGEHFEECKGKDFKNFLQENSEKIHKISEANTTRNEKGQIVIPQNDEWRNEMQA